MVELGKFRQDLFYRIHVIDLKVPSLAERREDILPLAEHFLAPHSKVVLSESAQEALLAYRFPGNIRELENILERALTLCEGKTIEARDLQLPKKRKNLPTSSGGSPLEDYLGDVESQRIVEALESTRWNKTQPLKNWASPCELCGTD